ncbi:MAG: S-layer homology domain-containing protein [bacterium]
MIKRIVIYSAWLMVAISLTIPCYGATTNDISKLAMGVRSVGLGGASVALSADPAALFANPARLGEINAISLTTMNTQLLGEIGITELTLNYPTEWGVVGAGYIGTSLGDSPVTEVGALGRFIESGVSRMSYSSRVLALSYGNSLAKTPLKNSWGELAKQLDVGATLRILNQGFAGGTMEGISASGYALDLGLLYQPREYLRAGLTYQNLLGGGLSWTSGAIDAIPTKLIVGTSVKLLGDSGLNSFKDQELSLNMDYEIGPQSLFHAGVEWYPIKYLALRSGLNQRYVSQGGSMATTTSLSMGVGIRYVGFGFDYAYQQYELGDLNTHYFALSYDLSQEKVVEKVVEKIVIKQIVIGGIGKEGAIKLLLPEDKTITRQGLVYVRGDVIDPTISIVRLDRWKIDVLGKDKIISHVFLRNYGKNVVKVMGLNKDNTPITILARRVLYLKTFTDIGQNYFARDAIEGLATLNIVGGYPKDMIRASEPITREMLRAYFNKLGVTCEVETKAKEPMKRADAIAYIVKRSGINMPKKIKISPYLDLPKTHKMSIYIAAAKDEGMLDGLGDGSFLEGSKIMTRGEALYILSKTPQAKAKLAELYDFDSGYNLDITEKDFEPPVDYQGIEDGNGVYPIEKDY